jgi:hypothetical protein
LIIRWSQILIELDLICLAAIIKPNSRSLQKKAREWNKVAHVPLLPGFHTMKRPSLALALTHSSFRYKQHTFMLEVPARLAQAQAHRHTR